MADSKPTIKLWSVKGGELQDFEVSIGNDEVIATNLVTGEIIKFPGGISKDQLLTLAETHNNANYGVIGITEAELKAQADLVAANEKLLADLK